MGKNRLNSRLTKHVPWRRVAVENPVGVKRRVDLERREENLGPETAPLRGVAVLVHARIGGNGQHALGRVDDVRRHVVGEAA